MSGSNVYLVTGAAGQVGGVGGRIVEILRRRNEMVKAVVRVHDARAERLEALGAEVVVADLTDGAQVVRAMEGVSRIYFGMSISAQYLEATLTMAAAALQSKGIEIFVNMSQMTVSDIDLVHTTGSPQHRLHWLGEQALDWSGLPITKLRPTAFQESPLFIQLAAQSIAAEGCLRLPFGEAEVSPVSSEDVAEVAVRALLDPSRFVGEILELTGPTPLSPTRLAQQYAAAIGRSVEYADMPLTTFEALLRTLPLDEHVIQHIYVMGKMHREGKYRRQTDTVEKILGRPAINLSKTIERRRNLFSSPRGNDLSS